MPLYVTMLFCRILRARVYVDFFGTQYLRLFVMFLHSKIGVLGLLFISPLINNVFSFPKYVAPRYIRIKLFRAVLLFI